MDHVFSNLDRVRRAFEWKARWSRLRLLGNSMLVRSTILMPIIGYFILLNGHVVELLQLHTPWIPNPERLSVGWRVFLFFYGTILLALGSALFSWRCPEAVRKYASPVEYVAAEAGFFSPKDHQRHLIARLKEVRGG